jgi:uncharacterized membrane protein
MGATREFFRCRVCGEDKPALAVGLLDLASGERVCRDCRESVGHNAARGCAVEAGGGEPYGSWGLVRAAREFKAMEDDAVAARLPAHVCRRLHGQWRDIMAELEAVG